MANFRGAALGIAAAALFTLFGCEQQKYPWGRDTVDSFGNGRFQIGRTPTMLVLSDREGSVVVNNVKNWKAKSGYVFLMDGNGKCWKVDYRTGEVLSFERANAVETPDRKVFEKLLE